MYLIIRFSLIVIVCLVTSLGYSQNFTISNPNNFSIEKLEGKTLVLSFSVKIENTSNKKIGLKIRGGKFYRDGECLGTIKLLNKVKLKKRSNEMVSVTVQVDLDKEFNLLNNIAAMFLGPVNLKLNGKLRGTWLILGRNYPFEFSQKLSLGDFLK